MESPQIKPMSLGQRAYNAYCEAVEFKNFMGQLIPTWENLGSKIQSAWEYSANVINKRAELKYSIMPENRDGFINELGRLINKYSIENKSNTPDFILTSYLSMCLATYESAISARDQWMKGGIFNKIGDKINE